MDNALGGVIMAVMGKARSAAKWIAKADAWLEQRAVVMVGAYALIGVGIAAIDSSARGLSARLLGMAFGGVVWGLMGTFWVRRFRRRAMNQPT